MNKFTPGPKNETAAPFEQCKRIPLAEFNDTLFVYDVSGKLCLRTQIAEDDTVYPAPTLQEVMEQLPFPQRYGIDGTGIRRVSCFADGRYFLESGCFTANSVEIALQVWFQWMGATK